MKHPTIRLLLGQAVARGWDLWQLDVNNVFLQGLLSADVYMDQPPLFVDTDRTYYLSKLNKTIYGMKEAPRGWYNVLWFFLLECGFYNSVADTSLFMFQATGVILCVLVYVDDIIVTRNSSTHIQQFINLLTTRFSLKDMGELSYFLGLEVTRTKADLTLTVTFCIEQTWSHSHGWPSSSLCVFRCSSWWSGGVSLCYPELTIFIVHTTRHRLTAKRVLRYLSCTRRWAYFSLPLFRCKFMPFLTQIGLETEMITPPLVLI